MKIKSVRIKNFRGFADETVSFSDYTCLLGPNGAGKSTVLAALNIFFQEPSNATSVVSLAKEDFHNGNTDQPIEITVTFANLSDEAKAVLSHYVRNNELIVTATANFDPNTGKASVYQYGERLVFKQFAPWFEDEKNGVLVAGLKSRFEEVTKGLSDFPTLGKSPTKAAMQSALQTYEGERPDVCELARSTDQFYGTSKGKGKLEAFVQWIYIPAVRDVSTEAEEAGSTALAKLLQRTVRQKVNFDEAISAIEAKARLEYDQLLAKEQGTLKELSDSLCERLVKFAHPGAGLAVEWLQGSEKAVRIDDPRATIKATEGQFKGGLVRFGHGLQRSFLLVILQELASIEQKGAGDDEKNWPTLVLGIEEPELYQHPPQARHLSTELRALSEAGNQIVITTHSTYFVSGEAFDEIRLIRKNASGVSQAKFTDFAKFAKRISDATGAAPEKPNVARARLIAALRPEPSELYFCQRLILVEGVEDRAYITAALHLEDKWTDLRRSGMHILACDRKSNILQLLAISMELDIPVFVIFDADGDVTKEEHRAMHKRDNDALMKALGVQFDSFPTIIVLDAKCAIWPTQLQEHVKNCFEKADWEKLGNDAKKAIDPNASLQKNPVLIGELMSLAWDRHQKPKVLVDLVTKLMSFAGSD
jgi:putative ATP-dependent endonuclease of OLD family